MRVVEIAELVGGSYEGDADRELVSGADLAVAGASDLAFVESRGRDAAIASKAGCLLIGPGFEAIEGRTQIRVDAPRNAFAKALARLRPVGRPHPGIHESAVVSHSTRIGEEVSVGPLAVIESGAVIGDRCVVGAGCIVGAGVVIGEEGFLYAGVRIYAGTRIGARAILHSGCVLGSDGFGFVFEGESYQKFPQIGRLEIGDDAEIGANTTIDRGALGATVLGDGVKLDNLVHIGHNCTIGRHVVIAAQTGLAGGVVIEDYAVIGGQVGMGDKARIGKQAVIGSGAGVLSSQQVAGGVTYWGTPARPYREHLRGLARIEKLPEALAEIKRLRQRIEQLEERD